MYSQKNRISEFISNLFNGELADAQCAVILGDNGTQLRGINTCSCVNRVAESCSQNTGTCLNYGIACGKSINETICTSQPMPPNTNFVSGVCDKKP